MRRTNQLTATTPRQEPWRKRCAFDWLVGQAAHWNELTYRRRQQYFNDNGNVWDARTSVRPMAWPTGPILERDGSAHEHDTLVSVAHLEWNDHEWTPRVERTLGSFDQKGLSESVRSTLAPLGCGDYERFPLL